MCCYWSMYYALYMVFEGHIVWSPGIISASVIIALIAATAAFWIMFRLLALFPDIELLRLGSAIIMSLAVNGMHYTGMAAAKFHYYEGQRPHYPKSNLISQTLALDVSIIIGVILIFILLIVVIADMRSWYYNLQHIVQIADAQAKIYREGIKSGQLRDQAFVNDWLELRRTDGSSISLLSLQHKSLNGVSRSRSRHSSRIVPSLIRSEIKQSIVEHIPITGDEPNLYNTLNDDQNKLV